MRWPNDERHPMTPSPSTSIAHHPDAPLLMAHAAGTLPEAFSLVVATHVSLCDRCRAEVAGFEALGGAVLDTDVAIPDGMLAENAPVAAVDDVLARAESESPTPATPARPQADTGTALPAPLRGYVGGGMDQIRWRRIGGGIRQAVLSTGPAASARLLYIPAGQAVPDHGHRGMELTLVLDGSFSDSEASFGRGDLEIATPELEHTPVAGPEGPCICLAATDAPLRFTGLIPRLAQRFMGL